MAWKLAQIPEFLRPQKEKLLEASALLPQLKNKPHTQTILVALGTASHAPFGDQQNAAINEPAHARVAVNEQEIYEFVHVAEQAMLVSDPKAVKSFNNFVQHAEARPVNTSIKGYNMQELEQFFYHLYIALSEPEENIKVVKREKV